MNMLFGVTVKKETTRRQAKGEDQSSEELGSEERRRDLGHGGSFGDDRLGHPPGGHERCVQEEGGGPGGRVPCGAR